MLKIRKYGDPILREKCFPVVELNHEIKDIIEHMLDIMYKEQGIGLAASQVGILKRIAVIDISKERDKKNAIILINPEIIKVEGEIESEEGCLSFIPELKSVIKRKQKIIVKTLNLKGKEKKIKGAELLSRVLQHEMDHLDGILFIDHMSKDQRSEYLKKMQEIECRV